MGPPKKIRTKDSSNEELVEKCNELTGEEGSDPEWNDHRDAETVKPPDSTIAIVVDVRDKLAAIRIFETKTMKYVDGVGTEEAGYLVIVPWQGDWSYFCTGSPKVGYIQRKEL